MTDISPDPESGERFQMSLPLCAYFEHDETLSKPESSIVFNDFHRAAEGPLYFFVPVNGKDAVRVAVCEKHADILEALYGKS